MRRSTARCNRTFGDEEKQRLQPASASTSDEGIREMRAVPPFTDGPGEVTRNNVMKSDVFNPMKTQRIVVWISAD